MYNEGRWLAHKKPRTWENHRYIRIENGRYIYPEDVKREREAKKASTARTMAAINQRGQTGVGADSRRAREAALANQRTQMANAARNAAIRNQNQQIADRQARREATTRDANYARNAALANQQSQLGNKYASDIKSNWEDLKTYGVSALKTAASKAYNSGKSKVQSILNYKGAGRDTDMEEAVRQRLGAEPAEKTADDRRAAASERQAINRTKEAAKGLASSTINLVKAESSAAINKGKNFLSNLFGGDRKRSQKN